MTTEMTEYFCGLGLKKATILIGIFQSILSFISFVLCAAYAEHPHELLELADTSVIPEMHVLKTVLVILSIANALQCVFSIMIIFGALTNRPLLLLPWLILNPISLAVYILGTIAALVRHSNASHVAFFTGHLLIASIVSLIGGYNIFLVRNYYIYLKRLNF
ncbi:uncharacterized protein LOC108733327 [Agrilus planipennis]|uniref:Uncharacterized protein LOC108733327 n=1 Tax=Agrilus planipennis TaxID=224129 RepID=A0A1W4WHI6_AGRPL|nr:uncharacterized protein LOC108733327 [Agrilus planipennis]XP_018319931.1 uncharacterized protein LOC108733327 [Agrilus planipennis]XP_018319932.1 uncharacterized protein LOC108733327 [Agrilus planipennis]